MTAHDVPIHKPCAVIDRVYKDSEKPESYTSEKL